MENKIYQLSAIILLFLFIFTAFKLNQVKRKQIEDRQTIEDLNHFKDSVMTTDDQFYLQFERNYKKYTKRELRTNERIK